MLTTSHRLKLRRLSTATIFLPPSRWRGRWWGGVIWIIWLFEVNTIYAERKTVWLLSRRHHPLMISTALTRSPTEIRITIRRQYSRMLFTAATAHFTRITNIAMIQVITLAHIVKFVSGIIIIITEIICQGIWVWWIWWCCRWCIHVHYVIVDIRRRMWLSVIFNAPYCTRVIWCWASVRSTASLITIMLARIRRAMTNKWLLLLMH